VGLDERDGRTRWDALPGAGQHRRGDIDAEHMTRCADLPQRRERRVAGAAADVEHALAGLERRSTEQGVGHIDVEALEPFLPRGPFDAAAAAPGGELI